MSSSPFIASSDVAPIRIPLSKENLVVIINTTIHQISRRDTALIDPGAKVCEGGGISHRVSIPAYGIYVKYIDAQTQKARLSAGLSY